MYKYKNKDKYARKIKSGLVTYKLLVCIICNYDSKIIKHIPKSIFFYDKKYTLFEH